MKKNKKKHLLILLFALLLFIGPFALLKGTIETDIWIERNNEKPTTSHLSSKVFKIGTFLDRNRTRDYRGLEVISESSRTINLGIYTRLEKHIEFELMQDNHFVEIRIDAHSNFWGFGGVFIRKNIFQKSIETNVHTYMDKKQNKHLSQSN